MIFRFVVRRLRWLARIPLLPQLFDALLLVITAVTAPKKLRAIEVLEERACRMFGAQRQVHRFGGVGFFVSGAELGHVHGNGLVDAFIGRANRDRMLAEGKAQPHHVFPASAWVSSWMNDEADVDRVLALLRLAAERVQPRSKAED